jgi:hypothetical protein
LLKLIVDASVLSDALIGSCGGLVTPQSMAQPYDTSPVKRSFIDTSAYRHTSTYCPNHPG